MLRKTLSASLLAAMYLATPALAEEVTVGRPIEGAVLHQGRLDMAVYYRPGGRRPPGSHRNLRAEGRGRCAARGHGPRRRRLRGLRHAGLSGRALRVLEGRRDGDGLVRDRRKSAAGTAHVLIPSRTQLARRRPASAAREQRPDATHLIGEDWHEYEGSRGIDCRPGRRLRRDRVCRSFRAHSGSVRRERPEAGAAAGQAGDGGERRRVRASASRASSEPGWRASSVSACRARSSSAMWMTANRSRRGNR